MKAKTFDKQFDDNQDVSQILDISKAKKPNQGQRKVNVDFLNGMITALDKEAKHLGVTRQSIINSLACRTPGKDCQLEPVPLFCQHEYTNRFINTKRYRLC